MLMQLIIMNEWHSHHAGREGAEQNRTSHNDDLGGFAAQLPLSNLRVNPKSSGQIPAGKAYFIPFRLSGIIPLKSIVFPSHLAIREPGCP